MAKRRNTRTRRRNTKSASRPLHHETLERRELLAADLSEFRIADSGDRVTYDGLSIPGNMNDPEASARALISTLEADATLDLEEVKYGLASAHVRFSQSLNGHKVFGTAASAHMGADGSIQTLHLDIKPDLVNFREGPGISFDEAVNIAQGSNGISIAANDARGEQVWYPTGDNDAVLAWEAIYSTVSPSGAFSTVVDALSGQVLENRSLASNATGSGDVFVPNPYQTQGNGTGLTDNNDATSAALDAQLVNVPLERLNDGTGLIIGEWADLATLNSPTLADVDADEVNRIYNYDRDDPRFEQVNIYKAIDSLQVYIHSLGFDDDAGVANGIRDFPTLANAHWDNADNSFYSQANDAIHFGDGGVDDAEDADIILHEYGHAIQHNQNAFWGGGDMGAMGEGFGDYIAASFYAADGDPTFQAAHDACVGEWDATSYSGTNPPCLRRVDGTKVYPTDLVGQVHADGEIWSRALWDIRESLGRTITDTLVFEHHFALPANSTMPDAANAMLLADANLNGGANQAVIRQAFVDRGILAAPPPTPTTPTVGFQQPITSGPRLLGVNPNASGLFDENQLNHLDFSPTQLTFRFDGGQELDAATLAGGIRITAAGGDNIFDDTDQPVEIGFLGFPDNATTQTVIARFAERLPDDRYRIEIFGEDDSSNGITGIRNVNGELFRTIDGQSSQTIEFEVEVGGRVIAVIPQPIREVNGVLRESRQNIDVYFDDADLFRPGSTIDTPEFYQLINTNRTISTEDDAGHITIPDSVSMDPANKRVILRFGSTLQALAGNEAASFRLRIGDDADFETRTIGSLSPADPGEAFFDATNLTSLANSNAVDGSWTVLIDQAISNGGITPLADNPGASDEVGHRDIETITSGGDERHTADVGDANSAITLVPYTFLRNESYGNDAFGNPLFNQVNDEQEERFREIMELYSAQSGIEFFETENLGLRLIVGDLFTADPTLSSGAGGTLGLANSDAVTMDFLDFTDADSNEFGGSFFDTALHEVGHAIGLGHTYDLEGAVQGPGNATDWVFPNPHDIVHAQFVHQREALDVDLYRVDITEPGTLVVQTLAERLVNASRLDSRLSLYEFRDGELNLVAANDDYFGSDAFVEFSVDDSNGGEYYIGVSADGNSTSNAESGSVSEGGVSEGNYQLRMEFRAAMSTDAITDADGSRLDGDRDGEQGGNYNFWFNTVPLNDTIYVRRPDTSVEVGGDGSLLLPFDDIGTALQEAENRTGETIVRLLPNYGLDGVLSDNPLTPADESADNQAFEVGFVPGVNEILADGRDILVPADTTLVIDAGTIIKLRDAVISVGSGADGVDRNNSYIQVLGTPQVPVFLTSYDDHTIGLNANPNDDTPIPGNWGGIDIRTEFDLSQGRFNTEVEGVFINNVNHAEIRYGGGVASSFGRVVDPVSLFRSRAEVSYNEILDSGNAAIAADPNAFEFTTFAEDIFQAETIGGVGFVPDYQRIGPDISGNRLSGNSTNGLAIRVDTLAGQQVEQLTTSARFDDSDIVHVLSENLLLNGEPAGPYQESVPASPIIGLQPVAGGDISAGTYEYRYTFVDAFGGESIASAAQSVTVAANGAVNLLGIPVASGDFVSRRLYRDGLLIAELDRTSANHTDALAAPAPTARALNTAATRFRARPSASLVVDPGLIVKSSGVRVDLGFTSTFIAEGTADSGIVFTSRADDRFGAGGTFDTNDDGAPGDTGVEPAPADWGGIYAGRTSRLSIDQALIAYAGGITSIDGTTAAFNAVEVHQADARIANSRFEFNSEGQGGQSPGIAREGRGPNSTATIHVTGAQPTIVGNTFFGNGDRAANGLNTSPIISINVNALDAVPRSDLGRQTGEIDIYEVPPGNHGPVVRGNQLTGNEINAMEVRGDLLYRESVWDDTDIVHFVNEDVVSTNFHTSNGLRLESSSSESLVVKLTDDAELLATGESLDIDDRIGGRIQVLGTSDHPVVLTSINDCTVGAGFSPDGQPVTDTLANGGCTVVETVVDAVPFADVIVVMDESISMGQEQAFSAQFIVDLDASLQAAGIGDGANGNRFGAVGYGNNLGGNDNEGRVIQVGGGNFGTAAEYAAATSTFVTSGFSEDGYAGIDFALNNYTFRPDAGRFIILVTDEPRSVDVPAITEASTLAALQAQDVRLQGIIAVDIEDDLGNPALGIDSQFVYTESGTSFIAQPGGSVTGGSSAADYLGLIQSTGGIAGDLSPIDNSAATAAVFSQVLTASLVGQAVSGQGSTGSPGDWAGIKLDSYSHDRNIDTVVENESAIGGDGDLNAELGGQQELGELAPDEFSGDDQRRLGFTVQGAIANDNDRDLYSFSGTAGTMVWIDIDRTTGGLDTVLEFLDGSGNVLALSNDSRTESINQELLFSAGFPDGHALPMQLDSEYQFNAAGGGHRDFNSLNNGDSAMRVVLPGTRGAVGNYFVRVRSNPRDPSLATPVRFNPLPNDLGNDAIGRTSGTYELQIRLQETDEIGGSIIRYADIRYAGTGITAEGLPAHTPMAGEVAHPGTGILDLGSMANTDRAAISSAGDGGNVEVYSFQVGRDKLQDAAGGVGSTPTDNKVSAVIDVDFSDGLTRPNLGTYLYHDNQLVAVGTDSNVLDDRLRPTIPNQVTETNPLGSGSYGPLDPFIGPLELSTEGVYQFTVANSQFVPQEFLQFTDSNAPNTGVRFEPLDSTVRLVDDRFGDSAALTDEQGPVAISVAFQEDGDGNIAPLHIGEVPLISLYDSGNSAQVSAHNPFTGRHDAIIQASTSSRLSAAAQALAGDAIAISAGGNDAQTSDTFSVLPDGSLGTLGSTNLQTFRYQNVGGATPHANRQHNVGVDFVSLAFFNSSGSQTRFLYGAANRDDFDGVDVGVVNNNDVPVGNAGSQNAQNLIYRLNPDTGAAVSRQGRDMPGGLEAANPLDPLIQNNQTRSYPAETPWAGTNAVAQIQVPDTNGDIVSLVSDINGGTTLLIFTDEGAIWNASFSEDGNDTYDAGDIRGAATFESLGVSDRNGDVIIFEQVTQGPANYVNPDSNNDLSELYYGIGSTALDPTTKLYAFDDNFQVVDVFEYGTTEIELDTNQIGGRMLGLFFSPLDNQLWHRSNTASGEAGHGLPALDNDARPNIGGGSALRFGFDELNTDQNHISAGVVDNNLDASDLQGIQGYNFIGGAHGTVNSNAIDLTGIESEDLPTLYFTYKLDTEDFNGSGSARDTLRAYVAGDDGVWSLVATNNFDADVSSPGFDWDPAQNREYDFANSNYGDDGNNRRYVQQLFDTDEFRQARIDLGPWAGQENVKLRFEFSTAGEFQSDQSEIIASPGHLIEDGHTLTLSGLMPDRLATLIGDPLPTLVRTFEFDVAGDGVTGTNIPIPINVTDTAEDVRDAIQTALANEIHYMDGAPEFHSFPLTGDGVRMYDINVTQATTDNPLKLVVGDRIVAGGVSALPVQNFGTYSNQASRAALIAAGARSRGLGGNDGAYIDDIVIGLAERGESVGNAGTTNPAVLSNNPMFEPSFAGVELPETVTGNYQVEVRSGREYGDPEVQTVDQLDKLFDARVELNERLAPGLNLTVRTAGAGIADGDTFTLSNGFDSLTFEFNSTGTVTPGNVAVFFDAVDTEGEVASAIRAAINTVSVDSVLGIKATNRGGHLVDVQETDPVIAIHGFAASNAIGEINFGPHLLGTVLGTDEIRGTDNGDLNRHRDQGQLLIDSNRISFSADVGIRVSDGNRAPHGPLNAGNDEGNRPKPGAVQNFPTLNVAEQIPGAVVRNNLLYENVGGGILLSGDAVAGAPASYTRVLNNTVYGSNGAGIRIEDGVAPAILNNVLVDNTVGLSASNVGETLVRSTVFEGNGTTSAGIGVGTEAIVNPGVELFFDSNPATFDFAAGAPNFYPAPGSPLIDSSIQSQDDRVQFVSVREVVGLPPTPIIVSELDLFGQERTDDPTVNNTSGQGAQIFIDTGAIESSDDAGPTAELLVPLDNNEFDVDPRATIVQLSEGRLFQFDVQLIDENGTGIDASTVTGDQISLTENGILLTEGRDYNIGYGAGSNLLRFTPTAGEWRPDSVYVITLVNQDSLRIDATSGLTIADGDQIFLEDEQGNQAVLEYEVGNALHVPQTLAFQVTHVNTGFVDGEQFDVVAPDGTSRRFEINLTGTVQSGNIPIALQQSGTISGVRDAFIDALNSAAAELDLVPIGIDDDIVQLGVVAGHVILPVGGSTISGMNIVGTDLGIEDRQEFTYTTGTETATFLFTVNPTLPEHIPFDRALTRDQIAANIADVLNNSLSISSAISVGDGVVSIGNNPDDVFSVDTSQLQQIGSGGVEGSLSLTVPFGITGAIVNNDTFTVTVGGRTEIFQFSTSDTSAVVGTRVHAPAAADQSTIAAAIVASVNTAFGDELSPTANGNVVLLGEDSATITGTQVRASVDVTGSPLVADGTSGGAIPIAFFPTSDFSATSTASEIASAIERSSLEVTTTRPGGGILLLNGIAVAQSITGGVVEDLGQQTEAVSDLAGNALLPNQITGETRFTIVMPNARLDHGDAFSPPGGGNYETLISNNGARHALVGPRLGEYADSEDGVAIARNGDDVPLTLTGSSVAAALSVVNDMTVPTTTLAVSGPISAGDAFTINVGSRSTTFELVPGPTAPAAGNIAIPFAFVDVNRPAVIAQQILAALMAEIPEARNGLDVRFAEDDATTIVITATNDEDGVPVGSFVDATTSATTIGLFLGTDDDGNRLTTTSDPADVIGFFNLADTAGTVVPVTVTGSGLLDVWIDLNQDGDFQDFGEQVVTRLPVIDGSNGSGVPTPGNVNVSFPQLPANTAIGQTWARFRISTGGSPLPGGLVSDGEVEDYPITIHRIANPIPVDDVYVTDESVAINGNGVAADALLDLAETTLTDDSGNPVAFTQARLVIDSAQIAPDTYRTANGQIEILDYTTGAFVYTPDSFYFGPDEFTYRLTTQQNGGIVDSASSSFATVSITVNPVNQAPNVTGLTIELEESRLSVDPTTDGDPATVADVRTITETQIISASSSTIGADPGVNIVYPFDESNQRLEILSISTPDGRISGLAAERDLTLVTVEGGLLSATFRASDVAGRPDVIASVQYTPPVNLNRDNLASVDGDPRLDSFDFVLIDDGVSLVPDDLVIDAITQFPSDGPVTASNGLPLQGTGTAFLDLFATNDPPELMTDVISETSTAFQDYFDDPVLNPSGQLAPMPLEGQPLVFPSDFLLQNDLNATDDAPSAADDELQQINDGAISVIDVSLLDPSLGTIQLLNNGGILLTPAPFVFGDVLFEYTVLDQGVDQPLPDPVTGISPLPIPNALTTTQISTITLTAVNDPPLAYDRFLTTDEDVALTILPDDLLIGVSPTPGTQIVTSATSVTLPDGSQLIDGETVTFVDTTGEDRIVEFNTTGIPSNGTDRVVTFAPADLAADIAVDLLTELIDLGVGGLATGGTIDFVVNDTTVGSALSPAVNATGAAAIVVNGQSMQNGDVITVTEVDGTARSFVFNTTGIAGVHDAAVQFAYTDTAQDIAIRFQDALIANGIGATNGAGFPGEWQVDYRTAIFEIDDVTSLLTEVGNGIRFVDASDMITPFETVTVTDDEGIEVVVEFNLTGISSDPADLTREVIQYGVGDTASQIAAQFETVVRSLGLGATATGGVVDTWVTLSDSADAGTSQIVLTPTSIELPDVDGLINGEQIVLTNADGVSTTIEFNVTGVASLTSDAVVQFAQGDTTASVAASLEAELRNVGYGALVTGTGVLLSNTVSVTAGETPAAGADVSGTVPFPYNEAAQPLNIVAFETSRGIADSNDLPNGTGTLTIETEAFGSSPLNRGSLVVTFLNGVFVSGEYTPPVDYNENAPFRDPRDSFTFIVGDLEPSTGERARSQPATATITVEPVNDAPTFTVDEVIDVLEDESPRVVTNVMTNVLPAPPGAIDELAVQDWTFELTELNVPDTLFSSDAVLSRTGELTVFPAQDQIGQATYEITVTDDVVPSRSTTQTITVNVRPVNDPPIFVDANGDPIADGTVTHTLREDNTQPGGDTSQSYFIPFNGPNGLLSVFAAGPANELDGSDGGSQTVSVLSAPSVSDLGGSLTFAFDGNNVANGLNYTPPLNYNNLIGGPDGFTYDVIDDSADDGESWSIDDDSLVSDPRRTSNRVVLNLTPVNDRPEVEFAGLEVEVLEQSTPMLTEIGNFAPNVLSGPPATAFDEVGQTVDFTLDPVGPNMALAPSSFDVMPDIIDGTLTFTPAAHVFGEFLFEISYRDNGADVFANGDLPDGLTTETLTLNIRPVNDPPVLKPDFDPADLHFELLEDGSVDVLVVGDLDTVGLLDVFLPGPANESSNITPGGNQQILLASPSPSISAEGGAIEQIVDSTGALVRLRYTPRQDFVGEDSFIYTVVDDGVTVDLLTNGEPFDDPRIASHTVSLNVVAVNDRPQFSGAGDVSSDEDEQSDPADLSTRGVITITDWATNVRPGPATAVDEAAPEQTPAFTITQVSGPDDLFDVLPTASIANGRADLNYTTAQDANGVAVFEVQLDDFGPNDVGIGDSPQSEVRTFTITVNSINDAPTFDNEGPVVVREGFGAYSQEWATNVLAGPADESDQNVRFELDIPENSLFAEDSAPTIDEDGFLRFTTAPFANGSVTILVTAIDSASIPASSVPQELVITIDPVNDSPTAVADEFTENEDTELFITHAQLLANDTDPDLMPGSGEVLSIVDQGMISSVSGVPVRFEDGQIVYDPRGSDIAQSLSPGETLVDSFAYFVEDNGTNGTDRLRSQATVTINVTGENDAPVLGPDPATLNPNGPTVIAVLDNDSDVDGVIDPSAISLLLQPAFGSVDFDENGVATYTPFGTFNVEDEFTYTIADADDPSLVSEPSRVTISINAAPNTQDDTVGTFIGEPVDIPVLANDFDPQDLGESDPVNTGIDQTTIVISRVPVRGDAIPQSNGTVRYVPDPGFIGTDTFQYTVADLEGRVSAPATVTVHVGASRLQNPIDNPDVNDDGLVTAIDALLIINHLNRSNSSRVPVSITDSGPNFFDVSGDQFVTARDALLVINDLNERPVNGEGEQSDFVRVAESASGESIEDGVSTVDQAFNKIVDAADADPVDLAIIDLIVEDRDAESDEDGGTDAIDAAMSLLI